MALVSRSPMAASIEDRTDRGEIPSVRSHLNDSGSIVAAEIGRERQTAPVVRTVR